ncbi:MAG: hypothetical protein V1861_06490 [Candidatus Micrarchaeota archaeon]
MPMPQETLIDKRNALIGSGHTDWRISCIIADEIGVNPKMVEARLAKLRKDGLIGENPNRQAKRGKGFDLAGLRAKLMEEGLCDGAIAKAAAVQSGRSVESLKTTISRLAKEGEAPENPNNQEEAGPDEFRWLLRRCHELASIGLNRHSISHVLACESKRTAQAIRRMIWAMEKEGLFTDAKANRRKSSEMQGMIVERARMMEEGINDDDIARAIAERTCRRLETIKLLIYRAVHSGGCPANPK